MVQCLNLHVPGQVVSFLLRHLGFLCVSGDLGANRAAIRRAVAAFAGPGHSGDLLRDADGGGCAADRLGRVWFSGRPTDPR